MKVFQTPSIIDHYHAEKARRGLKSHQDFRLVNPGPIRKILGGWTGRYFAIQWRYAEQGDVDIYDTRQPYEDIPF